MASRLSVWHQLMAKINKLNNWGLYGRRYWTVNSYWGYVDTLSSWQRNSLLVLQN
jgi:hypothetical protein